MEASRKHHNNPNDTSNVESNEDSSLDRTQFLLARLQELKAWQKDQEERLIRDQEEQMDQLACLPLNQIGLHTSNLGDGNGNGLKGLDYANVNENMAWTDNIRRGKEKLPITYLP